MNFQQLRSVREAERCGFNLTEGALVLHTSQPGVSRQVRELEEELGISCRSSDCTPAGFAEGGATVNAQALVILLYTVSVWQGEPQSLEGGAVGWFTPDEVLALPKPPLDVMLAERLFQNLE